ncbi:erythrocyte membrane protein 1 [Plasmodium falciparum IGH-CR14]|uniref:Erythrocyte membrane protein 1 n=1 Tax=Plasmodium falciparum IGH-CR14 TaxID=580059 RepID=A0A0L1I6Z7_PLAFA|nr:erythrocyte membrane protein 1 [Plasmodium falciparum IGH-CR14]
MAATSSGGTNKSAKEVLDEFGQQVYETVKKEADGTAKKYIDDLKGNLQKATNRSLETVDTIDPCRLVEDYYNNHVNRERYPCTNLSGKVEVKRFSDTLGGQCTREKISGSTNTCGACAPFRRLHLCHHNLEKMGTTKIDNTHKLLAEVCYAAKYEGDSIKTDYTIYKEKYKDSASQLCTVLARSFADIGDIVRGRDPFYGNPQEKEKRDELDDKLKDIFKKIYEGLTTNGAQNYYQDKNGDNFFKLREDWWTANRETVWKAITCDVKSGNNYFRQTACAGTRPTDGQCRCPKTSGANADQVPTYFDYVPQFLRWFEEWAEDFCRLRKHKLKDAIDKCRGEKGSERYCDLNRHDCEKTIRGDHDFVEEDNCIGCQYSCAHFVKWIDNQKLEFLKQKEKYEKEISNSGSCGGGNGSRRKRRSVTTKVYDGYEKKFYDKLKGEYSDINDFLDLLNKEKTCTKNSDIEEGGRINFKNVDSGKNSVPNGVVGVSAHSNSNKTFYRTTYCEACPWCGAQKENGGKGWKAKNDDECGQGMEYKGYKKTDIPILTGDKTKDNMVKKYNKFCNGNGGNGATGTAKDGVGGSENGAASGDNTDNATTGYCGGTNNSDSSLCEPWKCYYYKKIGKDGVKKDINFCVLQNNETVTSKKNSMHYNAFFWKWVHDMLHDSVEWKTELSKCKNKDNGNTCKNSCKRPCECFEKWVVQKKTEWTNIKKHFYTQDFGSKGTLLGPGMNSPDFVLSYLLEEDELLKIIEGTYGKSKEIDHIKELLEEGKKKKQGTASTDSQKKSTIVELLEHEEDEANKCKKTQEECEKKKKQKQQERGGPGARAETHKDERTQPPDHHAESEDEDAEDLEDDEDEVEEEGDGDQQEAQEEQVAPPATTTEKSVEVCSIVAKALKGDLNEACKQKYDGKYYGWRCVPTTSGDEKTTTSSSGAICVPPRRRKLYVGKLEQWAKKYTGNTQVSGQAQTQGNGASTETPESSLLHAFVKSAAVETFFLWHEYKKEWESRHATPEVGAGLGLSSDDEDKDPQKKLQESGKIPDGFLRQMFYTIADYRDILVRGGGNNTNISGSSDKDSGSKDNTNNDKTNIVLLASENKQEMEKIQAKIESVLKESVNNKQVKPVQPDQLSEKRITWWDKNAQHIWNAMVCALTYTETSGTAEGGKIEQNSGLKEAFFGGNNKVNPGTTGTSNGTFESTYDYTTVTFDGGFDESGDGQKTLDDSPTGKTKLENFIKRPFFFRWLEEWADEFCRKRTHKLEKIKVDCRGQYDAKYSSGDGEDCEKIVRENYNVVHKLENPTCAKSCKSYKKWINSKKNEFNKQENKYEKKIEDAKSKKYDKGFYTTLEGKYPTAKLFLASLKDGPCNNNTGDNKIDFTKADNTFAHAKNCDPCPVFGVKCNKGVCTSATEIDCDGEKVIGAEYIKKKTQTFNVDMLVSDIRENGFPSDLNEVCNGTGIFKGIRKDEWICGYLCGIDVCVLENSKDGISNKQNIQIRALFKRWVEIFLEDYNKINDKISQCMNNGNTSICIDGCEKKCNCVAKWIKKKREEWKIILERYVKQYNGNISDEVYEVKSFLEDPQFYNEVHKAIKPCGRLDAFEKSCGLNGDESSEKKESEENDLVLCLIDRLEDKIKECKRNHAQTGDQPTKTPCHTPSPSGENSTLDVDEEDPENKIGQRPSFCPEQQQEEVKEEEGCEKAPSPDENKEEEKKEEKTNKGDGGENGGKEPEPEPEPEQTPVLKPEEEAPAPAAPPSTPRPRPQPPTPYLSHPAVIPSLATSTLAWSVGIGFATFTYFYLKKKTKSSVGNLFQILQIPKSDYDIPTLKSKNRYIPYRSGTYKGRTYIYMEGDESDDYTYIGDISSSDITSSESEYEDIDINNIYPYKSPKYKTLIDVVLEPSKRDIQSDDTPTNKFTDNEWNVLKNDFITNILQSEQNDIPNNNISANIPLNTHPNTLYFDKPEEKPFITSIHDRNLYSGEEYSYDINMVNTMDDIPINRDNNPYSGIDLINDSISGNHNVEIYDEVLKRKENELFGTYHTKKNTSTNSVAKNTNSYPIHNQIKLFHKWLDRHRHMCDQWDKNKKEELLDKLKEEWNKENNNNSGKTYNSDNKPSHNHVLNTDVSIQIDMDNPKTKNEFTNTDTSPDKSTMDTIIDDLEKYNEPYYYDFYEDDIYYDVNDDKASVDNINMDHNKMDNNNSDVPTKVQIEMNVINNQELLQNEYPISDIWNI